jgi:two-component system, NtrC family, sensor histidine kinase GlrK
MRRLLPNSLNGFLLLGLGAIAAPLLIAILQATFQLRELTAASQRLVLESVQLTGLSQDLYEQIASLERSARLYQVLRDGTVFAAYRSNDEQLANTIRVLHGRMRAPEAGPRLDALSAGQQSIRDKVRDAAALAAAPVEFPDLADRVEPIAALIGEQINAGRAALQARTELAQRQLLWESTLLLPIFAIAILAVTLGLGRPLRQIDRAIGELGVGNFSRPIAVRGPVDVERLGRQLEWLRSRLVDLAHERNRFLRHMSHELKTPLANIREGTELLMDGAVGELDSAQREVTTILQENSIKLQRMIENLLSFSAWQSNSAGVDPSEFRVRPLVKQVLENQQLTLVSQRVRLDVQVEDVTLYADRGKIRLILENLLSNAIKYTSRGGAIYVRAGSSADQFVLEVADTGVGIPPADRPNIFDAFYTGRAPGGHIKGTGIGLSVVNEFVHVHNGTITIVDGEFSGAHFRIRMPLRLTTPVEPPNPERRNGVSERRNANAA